MAWILSMTVFTLIAGIALAITLAGVFRWERTDTMGRKTGEMHVLRAGPALGIFVVWAIIVFLGTLLAMFEQVEAGHVGVKREFGEISGQVEEGAHFIAPWQSIQTFDIRVQKAEFRNGGEEDSEALGRIEAASIDTQDVFMNLTVNWQVSPTAVQDLVRNVGPNFFSVLIPTRVQQFSKAETVNHTAVEVTQKREEIRRAIEVALQQDLAAFSITVVSVQIDNISYQPAFSAAIEAKQVATQDALQAAERVAQRTAEALQAQAVAKGLADARIEQAIGEAESVRQAAAAEADATRLRGDATADANKAIALSLTANLLQFEAIQKIDGVEIAFLPADGSILLDPTGILRRSPALP